MAEKKITDLQLVSSVSDSCNLVLDDGLQTYRFTPQQFMDYIRPKILPFSDELENFTLSATVAANALTIAAKTYAGTDATSSNKIRAIMRSATITSGLVNLRELAGALSLVIPSGQTIGTKSGVAAKLWVYLIDYNSGTLELAVSYKLFNESGIVTTVAIAAATDFKTMYSTTARTGVPYRLVGCITITEATAGTWATAPSRVTVGSYGALTRDYKEIARIVHSSQTGINPNNTSIQLQANTLAIDNYGGSDITNYRLYANRTGVWNFYYRTNVASTNVLNNSYAAAYGINNTTAISSIAGGAYPAAGTPFGLWPTFKLALTEGDYVVGLLYGAGNNSASTLTASSTDMSLEFVSTIG